MNEKGRFQQRENKGEPERECKRVCTYIVEEPQKAASQIVLMEKGGLGFNRGIIIKVHVLIMDMHAI